MAAVRDQASFGRRMLKLLPGLGALLLALMFRNMLYPHPILAQTRSAQLEDLQARVTTLLNTTDSSLPRMIESSTRWDYVGLVNGNIVYDYTLTTVTQAEVGQEDIRKARAAIYQQVRGACHNPDFITALDYSNEAECVHGQDRRLPVHHDLPADRLPMMQNT